MAGSNVRFWSKADVCCAKRHVRFTPKADMCGALAHVGFVPKADMAQIPACLIADVNMPTMIGIELYRCLHAALTARPAK
jgi:CheY-like chemotaxis protein